MEGLIDYKIFPMNRRIKWRHLWDYSLH
jgi:hypothetical protein